jgi:creatinine amidohydrolase
VTRKHVLAEMTFREFEQRLAENPVILLPLGSQEEQGPTSPMGDFMLTEALAGRIAERSGAIAAATLPFGYADYFRPVPGGIQLRAETFCLVLRDLADNFLNHALTRLVILNGHSGNAPLIDRVTRAIRTDTGVVVPSLNLWRLQTAEVWQKAYGVPSNQGFGHGAEPLGSVYTHLFPALVRPDLIEKPGAGRSFMGFPVAGFAGVRFSGIEVAMPLDVTDVTTNGITGGDPAMVSADAGRVVAEHIVETVAAFIEAFRDAPPPARSPGQGKS